MQIEQLNEKIVGNNFLQKDDKWMYEKMVRAIDALNLPDNETLVQQLRQKLPKVYTEKDLHAYCDALNLILKIGIDLDYTPMMLYLPARPNLKESLVSQFQHINKAIATRKQNKDWFHDLFALFVAMPNHLNLSWDDIEPLIIDMNDCPNQN
jgi:dimeric dUTPase (all-alpha-NTP-PPase superfamily)